uniref:Coiled-coil domain-containing protein 86 n=1 Tax=Meloidogyne floridensis TaxID=298350 RepID=A0A915NJS2_9BILA
LAQKESLAELVAHDRQMRALKSMLKDEQEEKTERLDICFKEIKQFGGLISSRQSNKIREDEEELEDNYDFLYHQLQFQPTIVAQPNNVLNENKLNKTVDQQKKEKKTLENPEQLEKEEKAKKAVQSKIAKEREKKWAKRVKNERRNTIKYLRKEAKNSAKLFIEKRRQIRKERDEKTKKILQSLEVQESEYKKLQAIGGKI